MPFRVKNIRPFSIFLFGTEIKADEKVDLLTVTNAATIRISLLSGSLYSYIQGRSLTIVVPRTDVPYLNLSELEYSRLTHAGFFQSSLGFENLKPPWVFNSNGHLMVESNSTASLPTGAATEAKQDLLNGYVVPGTWIPATGAVPNDSSVISNTACNVRSVIASNRTASTVYMMLFDASAVPADSTAPRIPFIAIPGESTVQIALGGMVCSNGLCWSTTTTFGVKTIGATTPLVVSAELV